MKSVASQPSDDMDFHPKFVRTVFVTLFERVSRFCDELCCVMDGMIVTRHLENHSDGFL